MPVYLYVYVHAYGVDILERREEQEQVSVEGMVYLLHVAVPRGDHHGLEEEARKASLQDIPHSLSKLDLQP